MLKSKFFSLLFRVVVSSIAAWVPLVYGYGPAKIQHYMTLPRFYLAWAISFPVPYFFVLVIRRVTGKLEVYDWPNHLIKRAVFQILFGFLSVALMEIIFVAAYAQIMDGNFDFDKFMLADFSVILSFIGFVNVCYIIRPPKLSERNNIPVSLNEALKQTDLQPSNDTSRVVSVNYDRVVATVNLDDVLYFYRYKGLIKVVTINREYSKKGTIEAFELLYYNEGFRRINTGTIINLKIAEGVEPAQKKNTRKVILVKQYEFISDGNSDKLEVTKKFIPEFTRLFDGNLLDEAIQAT